MTPAERQLERVIFRSLLGVVALVAWAIAPFYIAWERQHHGQPFSLKACFATRPGLYRWIRDEWRELGRQAGADRAIEP